MDRRMDSHFHPVCTWCNYSWPWQVALEFALNEEAPVNLSELRFHIPSSDQVVFFASFCEQHYLVCIVFFYKGRRRSRPCRAVQGAGVTCMRYTNQLWKTMKKSCVKFSGLMRPLGPKVVKKANIGTTSTGAPIAIFREITSLCPRGR